MLYNQKLLAAKSDIDLAHQNANKAVKEMSNVRSNLVAECQNHQEQIDSVEKFLELSANKSSKLRRAIAEEKVVIENMSFSRATITETYERAGAQSKRLDRIKIDC